jgi:uncharacterized protein (DUF983 family)
MSSVTAVRTRLTVCSACGHRGRLIIATLREVISRCHVCGDELRTERVATVEVPRPMATPAARVARAGA